MLQLDVLECELSVYESEEVSVALQTIHTARTLSNVTKLESAVDEAQVVLARVAEKFAADRSRAALLAELKNLGYDVQEGMLAQLAIDSQMVLVNPKDANYGVELTTPPGNKMQVRAVAFISKSNSHDANKDKDIEEAWCGDLKTISNALQTQGNSLDIKMATDAGALPLKVVPVKIPREVEEIAVEAPRIRHMLPPR